MSSDWISFNLNQLLPSGLSQSIGGGIGAIDDFLTMARAHIKSAQALQIGLPGGISDVITMTINAVTSAIEGFLQAGKVHVLFIPIAKTFPVPTRPQIPATLDDLLLNLNMDFKKIGLALQKDASQAYTEMAGATGGNKSFYNTFAQSLFDFFDPNRPQYFDANDAIVMSVILAGAPSFTGIVDVASSFNRVFRPPGNSDLTARTLPTPQNVNAKVVGTSKAKRVGVRLEWEAPEDTFVLRYISNINIKIKRYAIIRSTSNKMQGALSVLDLFKTRDLTTGLTNGVHHVIAIGSGKNSTYLDADESLDATKSYYYAVAWELDVTENGVTKTVKFDQISNVAKTRVRVPVPTQNSIPPDWVATKSVIDIFPNLAVTIRLLVDRLNALTSRSSGTTDQLSQAIKLAENSVTNLFDNIEELNSQFGNLTVTLGQPIPSLYATTIVSPAGGNAFILAELARLFQNTSDPNRPPFDGSEYVTGLCIVGGGPRLADIQTIIDLFNMLFGPSTPQNPLLAVLNALDKNVSVVESKVFGPNLQPLPVNGDGTVTLPNGTITDPVNVDPLTGLLKKDPTPVITINGTAVGADDPANPNQGDTNNKSLEDLC